MLSAPLPPNESERLARLRELFILDSPPEPLFDSLARMASEVCGTPIALMSLVDDKRQWFKAKVGTDVEETPREIAFCAHALLEDSLFEVEDATLDPRFADNPLVVSETNVRFYAGAPLIMPGGERIGTLCVLDHQAGKLTKAQGEQMRQLAELATQALTMRRDLIDRALLTRGQHETQLIDTAIEMADLYANAPCGFHSVDADGRFIRMNNTALGWVGRTRDEVIGKLRMWDFLDDAGRAKFAVEFPRFKREGHIEGVEFELISKTSERRHIILNGTTVRRSDGSFLMSRSVMFDVTELVRVKGALRRLALEQQAILDTDLIGLVKLRDRKVVWANKGIEHMLGYEPGGLLGESSRVLYSSDEAFERIGATAYSELRSGREFRTQLEYHRQDGPSTWMDVRAVAQPGGDDDFICMLTDVTAMKRAEEARLRALALEAENRQLVESNRVKDLFLGNMSHELHTPLNAVIGYAHVLQSGSIRPESPKFADFLGKIAAGGRQLLELIDTMLNFTKAESGKFEFHPEAVDVRNVVQDVADALGGPMRKKKIKLVVEVEPDLGEVTIDELRLAQVISNCLSNAIKFSHTGGRVFVRARSEGEASFRIEVEDVGIGIADADLPRLFTAFQQLSEGSTRAYGGAGLSLALTRTLVEAQGGTVGVSSQLGVGSLFHLVLPKQPTVLR